MIETRAPADTVAVLVYATFPAREAALSAGRELVRARLAACVNILPAMTSIYHWNGGLETSDEAVLIAKAPAAMADQVVRHIQAGHSYENPAVLVIPVIGGAENYVNWIRSETGPQP